MPSLLEALEKKYCSDRHIANANEKTTAEPDRSLISIFIPRLPPLLSVPELLVLNDCDIDCAGDFESIRDKCQRVRELDLAQNKLQDWQEVFHILHHMPRIEFLNLSKNSLNGNISKCHTSPIGNLRSIVLNGTYLDWLCIDVLLDNLPILVELHLSLNNYEEVLIDTTDNENEHCNKNSNVMESCDSDTTIETNLKKCNKGRCKRTSTHNSLKTLHFTGNPVHNWQEICRLGRIFPNLENLVLAECPIKTVCVTNENITTDDTITNINSEAPHTFFSNLTFLNLSYANINTWDDIEELSKFSKLKNLRVKNWPLWESLECTEHERRQLLIARLPNVTLLNGGGVISDDEREDSERAFIRHYMEKPVWQRPARYDALIVKHGQLDPLVNINLTPDKRVRVFLTYNEMSEPRFLDIYRTVSDLKIKLEKIIGLPANKMRLYYLDKDYREFGPEEMKYPNKLLYSYNIQTDDEIIVDEKK